MIARFFVTFLITAVPSVARLEKIRPGLRQLKGDEAAMIAEKHNKGVEAVMAEVDSDASMPTILGALFKFMNDENGIPNFDSDAMTVFAMEVFDPNGSGSVDFAEGLTHQSEILSATSAVMAAVSEVMSDLDNLQTVKECTDKVEAAAKKSGEEDEMKLANISTEVSEASGQIWNSPGGRRKLQTTALITIIIADTIGAIVGFALGGVLGAIVVGVLASVLAAFELGFPFLIC